MTRVSMKIIATLSITLFAVSLIACSYSSDNGMTAMHAHTLSSIVNHFDHAQSLTRAIVSEFLLLVSFLLGTVFLAFFRSLGETVISISYIDDWVIPNSREIFGLRKTLRSPPLC